MIYSYLVQAQAWIALAARQFYSSRRTAAVVALAAALLLGTGLFANTVQAQEEPAVPATALVNINTADEEALAAGLKGVGMARAKEIVRYRQSYGPFSSVEELTEVQGIGKATLDKNRAVITLE